MDDLISAYVPEAGYMSYSEASDLAVLRDKEAARNLKEDFDGN